MLDIESFDNIVINIANTDNIIEVIVPAKLTISTNFVSPENQ